MAVRFPFSITKLTRPHGGAVAAIAAGLLWTVAVLGSGIWWQHVIAWLLAATVVVHCLESLRAGTLRPLLDLEIDDHALRVLAALLLLAAGFLFEALAAADRLAPGLGDPAPPLLAAAAALLVTGRLTRRAAERAASASRPRLTLPVALLVLAVLLVVIGWQAVAGLEPVSLAVSLAGLLCAPALAALRTCPRIEAAESSGGELEVLLFRRSGVLTKGRPEVTEVIILAENAEEGEILRLAATAEYSVPTPLRTAILARARDTDQTLPSVRGILYYPDRGVRAEIRGKTALVGNLQFLAENDWDPADLERIHEATRSPREKGETVLYAAHDGKALGAVCLRDPLRSEASVVIAELRQSGVATGVLSGEDEEALEALFREVPVDHVHAQTTREGELAVIHELCSHGKTVGVLELNAKPGASRDRRPLRLQIYRARNPAPSFLELSRLGDVLEFLQGWRRSLRNERRIFRAVILFHFLAVPLFGCFLPLAGWLLSPTLAALASFALTARVATSAPRTRRSPDRKAGALSLDAVSWSSP